MFVKTGKELIDVCKKQQKSISQYTLEDEIERSGLSEKEVIEKMVDVLKTMRDSVNDARFTPVKSASGFTGGDSFKYNNYVKSGKSIIGGLVSDAIAMALSCSEINASMGRIVACPTAGSCGIVPAALISTGEKFNLTDEQLIKALFTASGVGIIIGENATFAGSEGGCQAECGSASAMAAAMVVEMCGGTPEMALNAAAVSMKTVLGLICDPVAGLVEIPCIKRNASGVVNAIACADLALSGVISYIPFDQVVKTMYEVGKNLPFEHRETAKGGLAITEEGLNLYNKLCK
ncbi:MAG: L-serine ammonia-lyase, iron-sulfur-dependent, subunit alpha [Oscillospiraceae bacterium]